MNEKQLIEFPIDEHNSILIETEILEDDEGEIEVSREGFIRKANKTFQDSLSVIKPIAETIKSKVDELQDKPKEIEVEFGLKMNGKFGVTVANTGVEGNLKIVLKWQHQ